MRAGLWRRLRVECNDIAPHGLAFVLIRQPASRRTLCCCWQDGKYAQEPRFVSRHAGFDEENGWPSSYIFIGSHYRIMETATIPLCIVEAKSMTKVVDRVHLPQKVPYGLHVRWFSWKTSKTKDHCTFQAAWPVMEQSLNYYYPSREFGELKEEWQSSL